MDGRGRQEEQKLQEASAPPCPTPCPPCPAPCPPCPAPPYPAPSLPGKAIITMQDGCDRPTRNGADKGADNQDSSQENLFTRPKSEATGWRRSSLREGASTPPPPPPPLSGAPVWERRPRVKTELQSLRFHILSKLETGKTRTHTLYSLRNWFCSHRRNKLSACFRNWNWKSLQCPSQPLQPQNVPFSHDLVPPPFTG